MYWLSLLPGLAGLLVALVGWATASQGDLLRVLVLLPVPALGVFWVREGRGGSPHARERSADDHPGRTNCRGAPGAGTAQKMLSAMGEGRS